MKKEKPDYSEKINIYCILTVIAAIAGFLYLNVYQNMEIKPLYDMIEKTNHLSQLYREIEKMPQLLDDYVYQDVTSVKTKYYECANNINAHSVPEVFGEEEKDMVLRNIQNMTDDFLQKCDETVNLRNNLEYAECDKSLKDVREESVIIVDYIKQKTELFLNDANSTMEKYNNAVKHNKRNYIFICLLALLMCVGIFISWRKHTEDEEKAQKMEMKIRDQEVNELRLTGVLRECELKVLQSQINPHFIFNTINIGAKLAMLNDDEATCEYLENASDIFRYNLKSLDTGTILKEEIENAKSYMYLLGIRFQNRFKFSFDIDESLLDTVVPRMSVQPVIENAYIHGIGELERGGEITISVFKEGPYVVVQVKDNGEGIKKDVIERILRGDSDYEKETNKKFHTTGIGLRNVIERMKLFYYREDVIDIFCSEGCTFVKLKYGKDEKKNV